MSALAETDAGHLPVDAEPASGALPPKQVIISNPDGSAVLGFDPEVIATLEAPPVAGPPAAASALALQHAQRQGALPNLERLERIRSLLIELDRVQIAEAEAQFVEIHALPIERVRKRTLSLLILDLFYTILQLTVINMSQTQIPFGQQLGPVIALVATALLAVFGGISIHKRNGVTLSIYVMLAAVGCIFTLRLLAIIWIFLIFRVSLILSATQLRLMWARQDRARLAFQSARDAFDAQREATLAQIDVFIAVARSAQWNSVARSLLAPGAPPGSTVAVATGGPVQPLPPPLTGLDDDGADDDDDDGAPTGSRPPTAGSSESTAVDVRPSQLARIAFGTYGPDGSSLNISGAGVTPLFRVGERGTFVTREASPGDHARLAQWRSQRAARVLPSTNVGVGAATGRSASSAATSGMAPAGVTVVGQSAALSEGSGSLSAAPLTASPQEAGDVPPQSTSTPSPPGEA